MRHAVIVSQVVLSFRGLPLTGGHRLTPNLSKPAYNERHFKGSHFLSCNFVPRPGAKGQLTCDDDGLHISPVCGRHGVFTHWLEYLWT